MENLINENILYAVLCPLLLMFMPIRGYYNFIVYCMFALLMVGIVGYDPVSIIIPFLFACGVIFGHLRIKFVNYPPLLQILIIIFLSFTLISFLVGDPVWNWVIRFLSALIFYYFAYLFIESEQRMRRIFFAILIGSLVSSFIAVMAIFNIWTPGPLFFPVFSSFRFAGLYNTTILGIFTAILIIWLLDETLKPKLWHGFILLKIIILIILFIQILFTLTRSAWLGLSIGLVIYFSIELMNNRLRKNILIFTGIVTIVFAASLLISSSESFELVRDRIIKDSLTDRSIQEGERESFYYTQNALNLAKDHPFGLGIGQTGLLGSEVEGFSLGAHNSYIHILADMGWLTFAAFMLIIIIMLLKILPGALKRRTKYGLSYQATLSNIIVLIVAGLYQDLILWLPMWLVPSFLTILVFSKNNKSILNKSASSLKIYNMLLDPHHYKGSYRKLPE